MPQHDPYNAGPFPDAFAVTDPGLTAEQQELSLDDQAALLLGRAHRTKISVFAQAAFTIGARRMDVLGGDEDMQSVHTRTLGSLLLRPMVHGRFDAGYQEIITGDEPRLETNVKRSAQLIAAHVHWRLNNLPIARQMEGYTNSRDAFVTPAMRGAFLSTPWPVELVALTKAVGMHYTAMRSVRRLATPYLVSSDKLPKVTSGSEERYWCAKLFGAGENQGLCYYLGYIEKSRPLLRAYMEGLWGTEYLHNRQVFLGTILIRERSMVRDHGKKEELRMIRNELHRDIGDSNFVAAGVRLKELAVTHPHLFSFIGLEYFTKGIHADPDEA